MDEQVEPGELTERFRAFSETVDPAPSRALPVALIGAGALALIVLIAIMVIIFK
jgi:hypothetical protein